MTFSNGARESMAKRRSLAVVLFVSSLCGCGGDGSSPSSPTASGYSGTWTGTTGQGLGITFTVVGTNSRGCSATNCVDQLSADVRVSTTTGSCVIAFGLVAVAPI